MTITAIHDQYADLMEAAQVVGLHPMSMRRLIKQRKVPATLWQGKYLIDRDVLNQFKANYEARPSKGNFRRLI